MHNRPIGLSPLARGTLGMAATVLRCVRFIPAGAGNTRRTPPLYPSIPVYPRWRGEHEDDARSVKPGDGLSPLARGTLTQLQNKVSAYRFIPAGAGNTSRMISKLRQYSVYPRWRGEHAPVNAAHQGVSGLSPLARGTHPVIRTYYPRRRFIPAGAGNTTGRE